jgi:hypothetical protein
LFENILETKIKIIIKENKDEKTYESNKIKFEKNKSLFLYEINFNDVDIINDKVNFIKFNEFNKFNKFINL